MKQTRLRTSAADVRVGRGDRWNGYLTASAIVLASLVIMAAWVAAGHGFPGGSILRRTTGQEGPTGGLTTAMRMCLRGDLAGCTSAHRAAGPMFAFLCAQIVWRAVVCLARLPARLWVGDLIASLVLFAAAIYVPWLTR